MRGGLTSIIPLIIGAILLVVAVLGFVVTSQMKDTRAPAPEPSSSPSSPSESRAPQVPASAPDAPPPAALSARDLAVQDEEDITRILLGQIEQSPQAIDQKWMDEVFVHVRNRVELDAFLEEVLAHGARYNATYIERKRGTKQRLSTNPQFYIWEAQNIIRGRYKWGLTEEKLSDKARGLLAMGLYRAHENARKESEDEEVEVEVDDEVIAIYFLESSNTYKALQEVATEAGTDPDVWLEPHARLLEAAIVSRYLRLQQFSHESRERLSGTSASGLPARVQIDQLQKSLYVHLLDLGRLYVEAATRELAYKGKQQEGAQRGFKALALVYRQTQSGDAFRMLRESNRIQRYNLWQMARASWRQARAAATAGDSATADDEYLTAKRRYLECLSRLEESKKPAVTTEFRRLQQDVAAWYAGRGDQSR